MQQQSNKYTIPEMQAQIAQLTDTINSPGVPADEIAIYQATIQRIQAEIQARTTTPAPPPPTKPTEQIKHTAPPPPIVEWPGNARESHTIEQAFDRESAATNAHREQQALNQSPTQPINVIHAGKQQALTPDQRTDLSAAAIAAHLYATPPTVTIHWPDWDLGPRTYTEGQARGALTTALRDLSESKLARQSRYNDLTRYAAWWRSIHYYRALTHFWGVPPTRTQLQLNRRDNVFTTIFNMVAEAAAQTQTT